MFEFKNCSETVNIIYIDEQFDTVRKGTVKAEDHIQMISSLQHDLKIEIKGTSLAYSEGVEVSW